MVFRALDQNGEKNDFIQFFKSDKLHIDLWKNCFLSAFLCINFNIVAPLQMEPKVQNYGFL